MKKVLFTMLFLAVCIGWADAQSWKEIKVGGGISFNTTKKNSKNKNETTSMGNNMFFQILPSLHYFVTDQIAVGGALGYSFTKSPNGNGSSEKTFYDKNGLFIIQPEVLYYVKMGKSFYYVPDVHLTLGIGKDTIEKDSRTTVSNSNYRFGLGITLCAFEFKPVQRVGISFSCGNLGYSYSSFDTGEDSSVSNSSFSLNFNVEPTIGVSYYFD